MGNSCVDCFHAVSWWGGDVFVVCDRVCRVQVLSLAGQLIIPKELIDPYNKYLLSQ